MLYRFLNTIWWLLLLWMLTVFIFFNFAIFNSQTVIAALVPQLVEQGWQEVAV
jgi:hypothetical protein